MALAITLLCWQPLVVARIIDFALRHLVMCIRFHSLTEEDIRVLIHLKMITRSPIKHPLLMHFFLGQIWLNGP
jgi:hypothetical protein